MIPVAEKLSTEQTHFPDPDRGATMAHELSFSYVLILSIGAPRPDGTTEVGVAIELENREEVLPQGTSGQINEHIHIGGRIQRGFVADSNSIDTSLLHVGKTASIEHDGNKIVRVFPGDHMTTS